MAAKKTLKVRQTGSPIRRPADQRATLVGLGLNKMGRVRELEDTPSVPVSYTHLTLPTKA